uniref:Peptidase S1 domain-containing protein n=1 Tax=Strigamia maritima TaxID=126957 RepID=T1JFG3_STRMM
MRRRRIFAWFGLFVLAICEWNCMIVEGLYGFNKIRPRVCSGRDGRKGTCMFALECQQTDGEPLGTCIDGFLVGSCCGYNDQSNQVRTSTVNINKIQSPSIFPLPTTTTLKWNLVTEIFRKTTPSPSPTSAKIPYTSPVVASTSFPTSAPPAIITAKPSQKRPIIIRKTTIKPQTTIKATTLTLTTTTSVNLQLEKECGTQHKTPQTRIVGGANAAFGSWPWQASVRRTAFYGFASTHRCGGAVVSSKGWVLTAGHCVDDLLVSQIRVRLGEYDFASVSEPLPFVERSVQRKIVHPKYNFYTYDNDLALVLLERSLDIKQPHISPICLPPNDELLIGKKATVTGWGRLSEGGVLPTILQEVVVPIVSNEKCNKMFAAANRPETIPEIMLCAGYTTGGKDSCQGDSGGPLQVKGDDGKWFLAGIISWGIGCGDPNLPGVCTRISKFKNWIMQNAT